MEEIQGHTGSHWMPPSGAYLHRIATEIAMVLIFGIKNRVVVFASFEASVQTAQNRPSTQLIEATSCVDEWHVTIGEQALDYILRYQMSLEDQN
jgi:hypothetical protein